MEHSILGVWDFVKSVCPRHFFKIPLFPHKLVFEKARPWLLTFPQKETNEKSQIWEQLSHFKSPLSATLMIFRHTWEDESRKVNLNAFIFSPTPWNFCPVMSQAVRKPCFLTSIPRGQIPRFPDAAGAAGRTLKSRSRPLPTHPGMKYFRKGDARCWHCLMRSVVTRCGMCVPQ